jgi:hypothetical protein
MPRMMRLGAAGLAGAALAVAAAAPASAGDVVLWACHGPAGQSMGTAGLVTGARGDAALSGGCGDGQTLTGGFTHAPEAGDSVASVRADVPAGLSLAGVHLDVALHGAGTTEDYTVRSGGGVLQTFTLGAPQAPASDLAVTAPQDGGDFAEVALSCNAGRPGSACAGTESTPAGFALGAIALRAADASAPVEALGWHSPAAGKLTLAVSATDRGAGLSAAQAVVDGTPRATASFGGAHCADLSPGAPQNDLPLGEDCPTVARTSLDVDTTSLADGPHALVVRVLDAAGNETDDAHTLEVANHVDLGSPTQTLTVGTAVGTRGGSNSGGEGGVAGATASSCTRPKLSMLLDQTPLRVSHGVPVLQRGHRYRFRGTLTCLLRGHRAAAPKRTRIDFLNRLGKRTLDKGGALVRSKGRVTFIVTALSTRTLIFRFADAGGKRVDVKIKVEVARR